MRDVTDIELEGYLDESLDANDMAAIEEQLRKDSALADRLTAVIGRRDAGFHSLGEIWRRNRLTCSSREQLGSYLLGVLPEKLSGYIRFHVEDVGCRQCQASVEDLRNQQAESAEHAEIRRRKYYQSSAGYLRRT